MTRLDWNDRASVRRWLGDMRVVVDDLDAVIDDMLRPHRERELGHASHAAKCREARTAIVELLAYALPTDDGGEHGDRPATAAAPRTNPSCRVAPAHPRCSCASALLLRIRIAPAHPRCSCASALLLRIRVAPAHPRCSCAFL